MPDFFTASSTPSLPPKCGSHAATSAFWTETYTNRLTLSSRSAHTESRPSYTSVGLTVLIRKTPSKPLNTRLTVSTCDKSPVTALTPAGSFAAFDASRVSTVTCAPRGNSSRTTCDPTVPVPPVTRMFMTAPLTGPAKAGHCYRITTRFCSARTLAASVPSPSSPIIVRATNACRAARIISNDMKHHLLRWAAPALAFFAVIATRAGAAPAHQRERSLLVRMGRRSANLAGRIAGRIRARDDRRKERCLRNGNLDRQSRRQRAGSGADERDPRHQPAMVARRPTPGVHTRRREGRAAAAGADPPHGHGGRRAVGDHRHPARRWQP